MMMKVTFAIILLAAYASCIPAKENNTCAKVCPTDYKPLCAKPAEGNGTDITFGSNCVLENYNCEHKDKQYRKSSDNECIGQAPVRLS